MAERASLKSQAGAIRMTLPVRLANDLDGLQRTLAELAERTGHPSCATGCNVLFLQLEREFTAGEEVRLNPQPLPPGNWGSIGLPSDPVPVRPVDVSVPAQVTDDIGSLQKAVAAVVGKLGCPECCSGFDIAFRRELDLIALNDNLEVQGFGRFR
jgi:hypothetical protein